MNIVANDQSQENGIADSFGIEMFGRKLTSSGKRWFVLYTKPRQEWVAKEKLERQEVEVYFPLIVATCPRRKRCVLLSQALLPRDISD